MNANTQARLISAICIGVLLGIVFYFRQQADLHLTRAQYLAVAALRYDRLQLGVHSVLLAIIVIVGMVCIAVGIYELVVTIVKRIMTLTGGDPGVRGS